MGEHSHRAIVVTGQDEELQQARYMASLHLPELTSPVIVGPANGHSSFMVAPDGHKLGWPSSVAYEMKRLAVINWLNLVSHSMSLTWVYIEYGYDNPEIIEKSGGKYVP